MAELERELWALGRYVEYPPTPALDRPVRERLALEPAPRRPRLVWPRGRRAAALAGVVVLGAGATAYAASESVRDAIRDVLGLEGATIQRSDYPPPAPTQRRLALGEPASLAGASRALAFAPLVPSELGDPDRLFVRRSVRGGELSLVYLPRPGLPRTATTGVGLLIGEFRGDLLGEYLHKIVGDATRVERLRIDGSRAAWIAGAPHFFFYGDRGTIAESELQLAENVLLVERDDVLVRIEGALGRAAAVRIARSLRPS